jgi:hypothetical protein
MITHQCPDVTDWDFPTAEELEAYAKRERESIALWMWVDVYYENELDDASDNRRGERGSDEDGALDAPVPR